MNPARGPAGAAVCRKGGGLASLLSDQPNRSTCDIVSAPFVDDGGAGFTVPTARSACKGREEKKRQAAACARPPSGSGIGVLALSLNSTVMNTISRSPIFSRSCTLNSPLP